MSDLSLRTRLRLASVAALAATCSVVATPSFAQITAQTGINSVYTAAAVGAPAIKGSDSAYDPVNHVYLIVGAYFPVDAIFVNTAGQAMTGVIPIKTGVTAQFPRVRYVQALNNGNGAFMVVWNEENNGVHTRILAYPGAFIGAEQIVSDASTSPWMESATAFAYSPTSQRFFMAWKAPASGQNAGVYGRLVDLNGVGVGPVVRLSSGFGRDPGVAWNPSLNEFGVSFSAETSTGVFSAFVRVSPADATQFIRQSFNQMSNALTAITDVDFNPDNGHYIMNWEQIVGSTLQAMTAELAGDGTILTSGLVSTRLGSYDALATAFSPVSRTFLLSGVDNQNDNVLGAELNSHGFRWNGEVLIGSNAHSHYTRGAASSDTAQWSTTFSGSSFAALGNVMVGTASGNGGGAGSYAAASGGSTSGSGGTTPPPPPPPGGCTTVQPGPGWTCVNGGWLPPTDTTTSGGTTNTGGCTSVQPDPTWTCVNGNWVPPTTGGSTGGSTGGCTTVQPGVGWTCVNGGWLPPGTVTTGGSTGGSTGGCTSVQPGADWTCVNGNWLPPGTVTTGGTGSTGGTGCTTVQPGVGWTCVNGNWLPPGSGGSTCTTVQPGVGWTCVNGNWLPPGTTTTSGGTSTGCTGSDPFAGIPGMFGTCVTGNWIPNTAGGGAPAPAPEPIALNMPAASAPPALMPLAETYTLLE